MAPGAVARARWLLVGGVDEVDVAPAFSTTKAAELVVLGGEILRVRAIETLVTLER